MPIKKTKKKLRIQKINFRSKKFLKRLGFLVILILFFVWLFWKIPLPTNLTSRQYPVSTKIFDRNGKVIYEIYADKRRTPIKLADMPPYIKQATIAIEDKDFYKHYGFSPTGIVRALYSTVFKRKLEGGSTLTQQLVKNVLLTSDRTIKRKLRELALTIVVEATYSKDQILEMYLNQIPYGSTAYGIEAAAELYFDKQAKDLNLAESALLAGLLASPTRYSPFGSHPELAKERQEEVLKRIVENHYITNEEADKAKSEELKYAEVEVPKAPHFALWIKEQLAEKYGEIVTEQGGLRVTTTLDLGLEEFAQTAVASEVAKLKKQKVGNGAVLVTRPKTGEILAMVGSKDYFAQDEDGKVNIILAKRQPGSSIKPLNYSLALRDKKITPSTVLADVSTCFLVEKQPLYCPSNYDGNFHGAVQVRFALGNSYNIPAVRVLALNGLENFVEFAKKMGITTFTNSSDYGLSLTLGGGEVRPYDMGVAFGVFANEGVKVPLISILKVETWDGKILEETDPNKLEGDRVLDSDVTYLISHILLDNNARSAAFGESSFLNVKGHPEVSVKTGTTNDRRDNWTIGYTADAVVVTWVGNNDNSPMSGAVSGVSGASPIWNKVIKETLDKAEKGFYSKDDEGHAWPRQPNNVVGKSVCWTTGLLAENSGCSVRFEYFLKEDIPTVDTNLREDIHVDKNTHEIAKSDASPDTYDTQNHPVIHDPLGTTYCLDCAPPTQPVTIKYPL